MMMVQVTQSGTTHQMSVDQIEFVRKCRYLRCHQDKDGIGDGWFLTVNVDQVFCSNSHRAMQYQLTSHSHHNAAVSLPPLSALLH